MFKLIKWGIILGIVAIFFIAARLTIFMNSPCSDNDKELIIEISQGQGLREISKYLENQRIISDSNLFILYAFVTGGANELKAGEYAFKPSMSPGEILGIITSGKTHVYKVTVPEGYNISQIADLLEGAELTTKQEFLDYVEDPKIISGYNLQGRSLEGYLFPSTYYFTKKITVKKIVQMMLSKFNDAFNQEFQKRAKELGFSKHDIVILASIIEKETGNASERPKISAVFHNRLTKRMRLQSDPTVIYGIKNFNGNLTKNDLETMTPYNTYKNLGLPEGPIANPGYDSLKAALWPEKVDYLYFVSMNDGRHFFSTNYNDHVNAVNKYQKKK